MTVWFMIMTKDCMVHVWPKDCMVHIMPRDFVVLIMPRDCFCSFHAKGLHD